MTNHPSTDPVERIAGYTYGTDAVARSPLALEDLQHLKRAVGWTDTDEHYRRAAAAVLAEQAGDMVDAWRAVLSEDPHLASLSAKPDGSPNPDYSAASKPRFVRWIIDVCTRDYDQTWLDYQEEIALRHTRAKKNRTDEVDSADHIPLRYLLAFSAVVTVTARQYLAKSDHPPEELQAMHDAWTKAVLLHVTLWSRPYVADEDW